MKRKIFLIFSMFILAILNSIAINAQTENKKTYYIDQYGISLEVPEEFAVITQNTKEDDLTFKIFKFELPEVIENYKKNNIFLNAIAPDISYEATVKIYQNNQTSNINNLKNTNGSKREEIINSFLPSNDTNYSEFNSSKLQFIRWQESENSFKYCIKNCTIFKGNTIEVNLTSYKNPPTTSQIDFLNSMINSIHFNKSIKLSATQSLNSFGNSWLFIILLIILLAVTGIILIFFVKNKKILTSFNWHKFKNKYFPFSKKNKLIDVDFVELDSNTVNENAQTTSHNINDDTNLKNDDDENDDLPNEDDIKTETDDDENNDDSSLDDIIPPKLSRLNNTQSTNKKRNKSKKKDTNINKKIDPNIKINIKNIDD